MTFSVIYRRPAFINRPWIIGKLYDDLSRSTIIHCDAYVFTFGGNQYLQLEWRVGGGVLMALDTWLIEPSGLTPVWNIHRRNGALTYDTNPALHARVIVQAQGAYVAVHGITRVSLLCHYIDVRERDPEASLGDPLATRTRRTRARATLPDVL